MAGPLPREGPTGVLGEIARRIPRTFQVLHDVVAASLRDGSIHAGNLAYLSLVTLLPLLILLTAVAVAVGDTAAGQEAINAVLKALPANVAELFQPVIEEVLQARTGNLLWIGALVALWTVSSYLETVRDILHRAFGVSNDHSFIQSRLRTIAGTLVAMLLLMVAVVSQVTLVVGLKAAPIAQRMGAELPGWVDLSQLLSPLFMFLPLWALFKLLTPRQMRRHASWPGALVATAAWVAGSYLLSPLFASFGRMSLTYGALSGVMLALLFFWGVGFALVVGAELNAALARQRARA